MAQLVTTTPLNQMRAIGSAAERSLPRLQAVLDREFPGGIGLNHAEPIERKDGSGIDWYTDHEGGLVRLVDLPAETATAYRARLHAIVHQVLQAAAGHESRNEAVGRSIAQSLRNAVTFPGEENVWIASDPGSSDAAIVLTAWGYEQYNVQTSGGDEIARHVPVGAGLATAAASNAASAAEINDEGPAPSPNPRQARRAGGRWSRWRGLAAGLLWIAPLVLAVAIGWFLLPSCGARMPFGGIVFGWGDGLFCKQPQPELADTGQRTRQLLVEVAVLEEQLRRQMSMCVPPQPEPVVEPTPEPEPEVRETENLIERYTGQQVGENESMVSLVWGDGSDLDLMVRCPDGVFVPLEGSRCGAVHRLDMNYNDSNDNERPAENVTWGDGPMPSGHYEISVRLWNRKSVSTPQIPFKVFLKRGSQTQVAEGSVSDAERMMKIMEFNVP